MRVSFSPVLECAGGFPKSMEKEEQAVIHVKIRFEVTLAHIIKRGTRKAIFFKKGTKAAKSNRRCKVCGTRFRVATFWNLDRRFIFLVLDQFRRKQQDVMLCLGSSRTLDAVLKAKKLIAGSSIDRETNMETTRFTVYQFGEKPSL